MKIMAEKEFHRRLLKDFLANSKFHHSKKPLYSLFSKNKSFCGYKTQK